MVFTKNEKLRYHRQIIMADVGLEGQMKLREAKVLVVGAGGLGSPLLYYLAAMGIGNIGIADPEEVDLSNLQRQILYTINDIGKSKAKAAKDRLKKLNPDVKIEIFPFYLNEINSEEIIVSYDIIVASVDNISTRYFVNDTCIKLGKPFVEAGVSGWEGMIMTVLPGKTPCYRCVIPAQIKGEQNKELGVIGCLAGILGTMQAMEVVKLILGKGNNLQGRLVVFNGYDMSFEEVQIAKNPKCKICGKL